MSKPLTMTVEQEREYRACCTSGGTEVDPVFAELDATRAALAAAEACNAAFCEQIRAEQAMRVAAEAKLANERRHADALLNALHNPDNITVERAIEAHHARRAAEVANG